MVLTTTGCPLCVPVLASADPPEDTEGLQDILVRQGTTSLQNRWNELFRVPSDNTGNSYVPGLVDVAP